MVNPEKVEVVEKLTEEIKEARDLVITDYRGLTVEETETLRNELYEKGSRFHVVKNRLAKRALKNVYGSGSTADVADETEEEATETETEAEVPELELDDISGVGPSKVEALNEAEFETVRSVAEASIDELTEVSGVGESTAEKFKENAQQLLEEQGASGETETDDDDTDVSELELEDISGVGPSKVEALNEAEFETVRSVAEASIDELTEVSGIGEGTAEKFKANAGDLLEEHGGISSPGDDEDDTSRSDEPVESADDLLRELDEYFQGTTAIALSGNGYGSVAEVLVEFAEEHEDLTIKGGLLNGGILDRDEVEAVSELPSRRELLTSLAGALKKPIQKLAYSLNYPMQKLVQQLEQIKDEKESSS